jgi:2-alkyl-3-oxoalkanoate reductase
VKVLVAGAAGTLGLPLVQRLVAAGDEVSGLTLTDRSAAKVRAAGAHELVADALDPPSLLERVRAANPEVIVHLLTALPKRGPTRASQLSATNRLRTDGTANLLAAGRSAGVRRIVAESVVFAYGFADLGDRLLDETAAPAERAPSAGMKNAQNAALSLERQVQHMSETTDLEAVVLRFGALYGPSVPSTEFMLTLLRRRLMALPGGGHSVLPSIELSDALSALEAAIRSPRAGGLYNVVDDEPVELREFVDELASAFATPKPYSVPYWVGRAFVPYAAQFLNRTVIRASNNKLKTSMGWAPSVSTHRDGIRQWAARSRFEP